jgi:hypothetical protein
LSKAAGEAERRRRARSRKEQARTEQPATAVPGGTYWYGIPLEEDCPDPSNHDVCPGSGDKHDWIKPHPRPKDHKYECEQCGHYDLDDYK